MHLPGGVRCCRIRASPRSRDIALPRVTSVRYPDEAEDRRGRVVGIFLVRRQGTADLGGMDPARGDQRVDLGRGPWRGARRPQDQGRRQPGREQGQPGLAAADRVELTGDEGSGGEAGPLPAGDGELGREQAGVDMRVPSRGGLELRVA
jgi:hypothetical protein